MYIEVLHDALGDIKACYCVDTLPASHGSPLFTMQGGLPLGIEQARINIDTLTAMEIDAGSGQKAVIDEAGKPVLVTVDRTEYIIKTFKVDLNTDITAPGGVAFPMPMKIRLFARK
jgi:hypothetical protein